MVKYRELHGKEIRIIRLLTEKDDPKFANGPVHCEIEYVPLEEATLRAQDGLPTKGHTGNWPPYVVDDIEVEPGWRAGADSNVLWPETKTTTTGLVSGAAEVAKNENQALTIEEEDELPWRYTWGDFVALSYVWGDATITREIFVDGMPMAVTRNLEAALQQLRNYDRIKQGFRIWVDAICINQEDLEERARQVVRMKYIYDSAWHITIWLGPEEDDSYMAMIAMRYLSLRSKEKDPLDGVYHRVDVMLVNIPYLWYWNHQTVSVKMRKVVLRAIYYILSRPYFRRLWVLQEIASGGRDTPVLCGDRCVLLEDVYQSLLLIRDLDGSEMGRQIVGSVKGTYGMQHSWDQLPVGIDTYGVSEKLWERPISIIEAQQHRNRHAATPSGKGTGYDDIFGALILSREANTWDERDRIYGILGLPCLASVINIIPDYKKSPEYTFTLFSKKLLQTGNLNGLRLVASPIPEIDTKYFKITGFSRPRAPKFVGNPEVVNTGCGHGLPSWVICWSCRRNPAINLRGRIPSFDLEESEKPSITRPTFQNEDTIMTVQGILFDTISNLSSFHATESDRSYPYNQARPRPIKSIYGPSIASTKEALWRTITCDTTRSGIPPPPQPSKTRFNPRNWKVGSALSANERTLFGLNDFYARNKDLELLNGITLSELITGDEESSTTANPKTVKNKTSFLKIRHNKEMEGSLVGPKGISGEEKEQLRSAMGWAALVLAWRRLVVTSKGYLGLAPADSKEGDVVAVLVGCDVPVVLRREVNGDTEGAVFRVVGEGYLQGIMEGELGGMVRREEVLVRDIVLC